MNLSEKNIAHKKIINATAYRRIAPFVIKPYQLNKEGEDFVVLSNQNLSKDYFEHLQFPVSRFWGNYFAEKLNILEPKIKEVMLDVCCGTGTLCLNIMPISGFSKCIAIDNSQVAIDLLKKRMGQYQQIEAKRQDITHMSFDDNSIDAVYGNSFLHHLPDNYSFLSESFRVLREGGVLVLTGEPTVTASFLEGVIMMSVIKTLVFFKLKSKKTYLHDLPVTDIWLYEENSLRRMLGEIGFVDITIRGFGVLVPLLNWPTTLIFNKIIGKSMQPEWYWMLFGWLDRKLFDWLPANKHSHFVIAARKPE